MRITVEVTYPADCPTVGRALADPDCVQAKVKAVGALSDQFDVTGSADGPFTVTARVLMATDEIPANIKALVPARLDLRQAEAWDTAGPDGSRKGTIAIDIAGAPIRLAGRMDLHPDPAGCRQRYDAELTAKIPVFGGMIEEAAAPVVRNAMVAQQQVVADFLARRTG